MEIKHPQTFIYNARMHEIAVDNYVRNYKQV